ncbi:LysR family transcriptional regulator [Rhizobium sp. BK376]|jgi:DNA-binding transcriptional LysR family regulator|uniref:LysR family transcriptional regulator n=1 Tax=Rhizobium sp. BK376 TaxID=2512149 RepID=UPI00104A22E7|nr:LysR family transcriptional regulator [Rhizobium sp. BK376]TCR85861.1 DNA-binding transcriptional LysR family regulator [Rhizobium sp. BK376]
MVHSSQSLPPLDTLETFARAARLGSFSAAAEEGGITHGAVSRQISRLERWLGLRLFARQARGVSLTPEGIRFFARTQEALALLGDTDERWIPRRHKTTVRLSLIPSVASLWLFSRLPDLEGDDIHLDLLLEHRLAEFSEGTDLAIRCGKGPWAGVRAVALWHEKSFPVAAPSIAKRLGQGCDARSLLTMPILHDSNIEGWRRWLAAEDVEYLPRGQDRRFEDYNLVIDACIQGVGIALARPPLSDAALASGRLVPVSDRTLDYHVAFHLVRPDGALSGPAMELARRLLVEAGHDETAIAAFTAPARARA